jgi:hypothetical protein
MSLIYPSLYANQQKKLGDEHHSVQYSHVQYIEWWALFKSKWKDHAAERIEQRQISPLLELFSQFFIESNQYNIVTNGIARQLFQLAESLELSSKLRISIDEELENFIELSDQFESELSRSRQLSEKSDEYYKKTENFINKAYSYTKKI